jgi:hypothetical protein
VIDPELSLIDPRQSGIDHSMSRTLMNPEESYPNLKKSPKGFITLEGSSYTSFKASNVKTKHMHFKRQKGSQLDKQTQQSTTYDNISCHINPRC